MSTGQGSDGVYYGPTETGKCYVSMYTHRGTRPKKTRWSSKVAPDDEFLLFKVSDENSYVDARGHYWSFGDSEGRLVLGSDDERLAKHPAVSNDFDRWHGYPVSPKRSSDGDAPTDDLVIKLRDAGKISRTFAARILRRRI